MWLLFALAGVAIVLLLYVGWRLFARRRLPAATARRLKEQWRATRTQADPVRRVLEADKVLDELLSALGYQGTTADKLRAAGPRLPQVEAIWAAHKLRNRIAHEPGMAVSEKEAERALLAFEGVLRKFVPE